ncbi:MAG: hypothetical protein ACTH1D_03830 [Mycobacteriaceae bacterium]|uniref:hypothetical protein n=1 Tax=Corynebacterium sp. TaxID=1720 RepID=UPI003F9E3BE3
MTVPFTVVKGSPDEAETRAIGEALSTLVAEAAASAAARGVDARERNRIDARTTSRGMWGTPREQLSGVRFNPTGFRG